MGRQVVGQRGKTVMLIKCANLKNTEKDGDGMSRLFCAAALLCLLVFTGGCAASFAQSNFVVREAYRSPAVEAGMSYDGVALISANGGMEHGVEFRKLLVDLVDQVIRKDREDLRLVSYWEVLSAVNRHDLNAEYSAMMKEYAITGVLDRNVLKKVGDIVGVKHFIHPRLVTFVQRKEGRLSLAGLSMIKTHESMVKLYIEVWDTETGNIDWVGIGEANMAHEHYKARPIPFEDVVVIAIKNVIEKMPKGE